MSHFVEHIFGSVITDMKQYIIWQALNVVLLRQWTRVAFGDFVFVHDNVANTGEVGSDSDVCVCVRVRKVVVVGVGVRVLVGV